LIHVDRLISPAEKLMATQILSPNSSIVGNSSEAMQLHLRSKSRYLQEARDKLFDTHSKSEGSAVAATSNNSHFPLNFSLNESSSNADTSDINLMLHEHEKAQERIAEEMVTLAQNLKQNCITASSIIKQDTQVSV